MTTTAPPSGTESASPARRVPLGARVLRLLGWTLVTAGAVVLLYLVYSLFFTTLETNAAQAELFERWEREVPVAAPERPTPDPTAPAALPSEPGAERAAEAPTIASERGDEPPGPGAAVAVLEFHRPGSDARPVRQDPLLVVSGVTRAALQRGPGHYPGTALPGQPGNFAVAGHRTTYGAPFFNLDQLQAGDEVLVTGRDGVRHVYAVREQRVVGPFDTWVVEPDPLGSGAPMLTLTTCHPRFSAAQRLVVFAELVG